jgi:K+ transporter
VNWTLAAATLVAVIGFGSSDALAGAYGIAVSLLMAITTLMATFVALHWKHNPFLVYGINGSLLLVDLVFFASTSTKVLDGGWFPLLLALVIAFLMLTWRKGEEIMDSARLEIRRRAKDVVDWIKADPPFRIPGTAVVLGRMTKGVPLALTQNLKHNHVLHERVLLVAVTATETPRVADEDRIVVTPISEDMTRIELLFGFMEQPDVPKGLELAASSGRIDILHGPRDDHSLSPAVGHAALARRDFCIHASQRTATRRLFQDPERADYGDRPRIRNLIHEKMTAARTQFQGPFGRNRRERCGQCDDRPGVLNHQTLPPDLAEGSAIARRGEEP